MADSKRTSSTHRKRFGHHQKQTKPFLKTYLPYLPLLTILVTGLLVAFRGPARPAGGVMAYATNVSTSSLLAETNEQRAEHEREALRENAELSAAAQAKANDMASRNYWSHTTPDGEQPWSFLEKVGYEYRKAGENLAYGFATADATVAGWMNSPSHRANMLDSGFDEVGFGYANAGDYQDAGENTIVVAMYGRSPAAAALEGEEPVVSGQTTTAGMANAHTYRIARIQIITNGKAPWSLTAFVLLAVLAVCYIVIKHSLSVRRMFMKGERFVLKHPLFDVTIVAFIALCVFISRVEGYILSASI